MKRIVVIEGTTKKVTQIKNITQLTKLYPQLSVTQDAVINTRALAASQAPLTLLADKDGGAPNYISVGAYKDALVSHDSSNTAYATAVVCTASIPTDTPNTGILKIYDTGAGTTQIYRYSSYATATFTLQTKSVAAAAGGSGTVLKISTGTFLDGTVHVGDIVCNNTDASVAIVVSIDSALQITTTLLAGGSDHTYSTSDVVTIGALDRRYHNDDLVYTPSEATIFEGLALSNNDVYSDEIIMSDSIPSDTAQASYFLLYNGSTYVKYRYSSAVGKKIVLSTLKVTAGSGGDGTTLIASGFTLGAAVGDVVYNVTDGSHATIVTVDSNTQVTTGTLTGGTNNTFAQGDTVWVHVTAAAYTRVDKAIMYPWKKTQQALEIVLIDEFI
jgi:hypothetical protein